MKSLKKLVAGFQLAEDGLMVLLFTVMIITAFAQVINRNIIKISIAWLEELARYSMIYLTMFAAEVGLRDGTQISVESVISRLPPLAKKIVDLIASAILTTFAIIIFRYTIPVIQNQISSGQITPGLRIPMVIPYFAICLGFGMIAVTQSVRLVLKLIGRPLAGKGEEN